MNMSSRKASGVVLWSVVSALICGGGQVHAQLLSRIPPLCSTGDSLAAFISLSGDFKNVFASGANAVAQGSLAVTFESTSGLLHGWELSAMVSMASSNDTLIKDYGRSLIVPKAGSSTGSLSGKLFLAKEAHSHRYLHAFFQITSTTWSLADPDTSSHATLARSGAVSALGLMIGCGFTKKESGQKDKDAAGLAIETGFSRRVISGDLVSSAQLRRSALNTDRRVFYCWEFGILTSYKSVTASLTYYQYLGSHDIPGFSGGQLAAAVSLFLDFVSF